MPNLVFFSFSEKDRGVVVTIKGRAMNSRYPALNFRVRDLLARWDTEGSATIKQAITKAMQGTSRTIVFVGNSTYRSYWVPHEVQKTLDNGKPVYAIRLAGTNGPIPKCLSDNKITVYQWSESRLQDLATR